MALSAVSLLVLVIGLATSCSGETLLSSRSTLGNGDDEVTSMMDSLKATTSKILPGENPAEVLPNAGDALKSLSTSFKGAAMQPFAIKVDEEEIQKDFKDRDGSHAIYGELLPQSTAAMLEFALKKDPNIVWDGEEHHRYEVKDVERRPKFLDLGSGFGKVSMLASLLGFDAGGYELTRERIDAACRALDELAGRASSDVAQPQPHEAEATGSAGASTATAEQDLSPHEWCALHAGQGHGELDFIKGSFTDPSVNFADVDVLFTDSLFWDDRMMADLGEKASKMKPGSIIISYKAFPGDSFKSLATLPLPTSWSGSTDYQVQQVVQAPGQEATPAESKSLRGTLG